MPEYKYRIIAGQKVGFPAYMSDEDIDHASQIHYDNVTKKPYTTDISGPMHAEMKSDSPLRQMGLTALHAAPALGQVLGSFAGGSVGQPVAGSAIGGGVGAAIDRLPSLLSGDPSQYGDAALDIGKEAALGGLFEGAQPYLSKGLNRIGSAIADKAVRRFGPPATRIAGDVAAADRLGMPMSVSQTTGSRISKFLEDNFTSHKTQNALSETQDDVLQRAVDKLRLQHTGAPLPAESPKELFGAQAQDILTKNRAAMKQGVNDAYKIADFNAKASTVHYTIPAGQEATGLVGPDGQPVMRQLTKDVSIEGPIAYPKTAGFINQIKPEIDRIYNSLPEASPKRAQFDRLKQTMDQLSAGLTDDPNSKYIADWKTIKEFRTEVYNAVGSKLDPSRGEGGLKKLADLLGQDIKDSVGGMWKSPIDSLKSIETANALHAEMSDTFNRRVLNTMGNKFKPTDPSAVFKMAQRTPEAAGELVKALGPNDQRPIKAHFFEQLMMKTDSPDSALKMLENPSYKKVFSASDRADLTDLFRTDRRVSANTGSPRSLWLNYKTGVIGLGLATGAAKTIAGDEDKISDTALVGATLLIGGKVFAEKVLMNPRFARSAARLASLAPSSSEATTLRKTLLTAMRLGDVTVRLKNGETRKASVKNGEVTLNDQNE